ncbi:MAG: hypothetical protein HUU35_07535, partial [Armatimonadetes bacterium]|nr:hypothetical protein [Armatimonadota bacterium]
WWGWLLVAWPALGLQWGCAEALHRIRAASMEASTARAEAVGLLSIGAGLGLTLVAIVALRRYPSWDLVSGLLAPVLVGLALCCGLQWTAATAEKLRPG